MQWISHEPDAILTSWSLQAIQLVKLHQSPLKRPYTAAHSLCDAHSSGTMHIVQVMRPQGGPLRKKGTGDALEVREKTPCNRVEPLLMGEYMAGCHKGQRTHNAVHVGMCRALWDSW